MLQVPRLDGDDFESIFARAKARIPTLTDEWTNFNAADPGITTLETFAWLFDTLHYYMNASGEVHRLKYFKLLGIEPVRREASCVLAVEGTGLLDLPRGTRVYAGEIPFETTETLRTPANHLTAVFLEEAGRRIDLTSRAGVDGGFAPVFTPQSPPESCLYLGFAQPLTGPVRLYLELAPPAPHPLCRGFPSGRTGVGELRWHKLAPCSSGKGRDLRFAAQRFSAIFSGRGRRPARCAERPGRLRSALPSAAEPL